MATRNNKMCPHEYIKLERKYVCNNYVSTPIVLSHGEGVFVWDVEGRRYFDFLSGYSCLNQGHCHPRIMNALKDQAERLTFTSRAFFTDRLGPFAKMMAKLFGYDRILPMNTGGEAGESAIKIARKWAYEVKQIPCGKAKILFAENNCWGRSLAAVSTSNDLRCCQSFGPYLPGFQVIPFNNVIILERALKDPNVAAFMVEPIQMEAGVKIPDECYLEAVRNLCTKANVLWIADEVQTGLGRTGKLLAVDHECVRPDILILGGALSGGTMPISCVLANDDVMNVLTPGTHGSTYGGNPMACAVAMEAVKVLLEEEMIENAECQGEVFRKGLALMPRNVVDVRCRGLLAAMDLHYSAPAHEVCWELCRCGILTKPRGQTIRLAPPLVITKKQLIDCICTIYNVMKFFESRL